MSSNCCCCRCNTYCYIDCCASIANRTVGNHASAVRRRRQLSQIESVVQYCGANATVITNISTTATATDNLANTSDVPVLAIKAAVATTALQQQTRYSNYCSNKYGTWKQRYCCYKQYCNCKTKKSVLLLLFEVVATAAIAVL